MPGIDFLRLEDAREDSPQARSLLGLFEADTALYTDYVTGLQTVCRSVVDCENALSIALQTLSKKLQEYEKLRFPLGRDDSILASTLKQFATTIEEVSSVHTTHSSQLNDLMVQPLTSFTNSELTEIATMKELNRMLEQEHENAIIKYCRVSKKKENETKARIDANDELFTCRKKILQNSLHYYNSLNFLQYKRTSNLLGPMLGFFKAQLFFFRLGKETLTKQTEDYLANMTESLQSVHAEMGQLSQRSNDKMQEILEGSTYYYMPEPTPDMQMQPRPVKTNLSQIAGYLMTRSKSGLGHRWDRQYFFTQGGNLMSNAKGQIAGSLVIDLDGCTVNAADIDDRRFVFQVTRPEDTKKLVTLQCMSESDRGEWIMTIRSISSGFYMPEKSRQIDIPLSLAVGDARSWALSAPPGGGGPLQDGLTTPTGGTRPKQPVSLSSLPQKQRADNYKHSGQRGSRSSDASRSSSQDLPATPPPSPLDTLLSSTPIQFDMISPSEEQPPPPVFRQGPPPKEGPQRRVNPFGDPAVESRPVQAHPVVGTAESAGYVQTYLLRFLGSMEVRRDKGLDVVMDTIRKIMAARAIHNIFKMTEVNLVVTSQSLRLLDLVKQSVRAYHDLKDVSFWAAHLENKRLFAFITRRQGTRYQSQFICHVFESDISADEICRAISMAADIAFQALHQQGTISFTMGQTPADDSATAPADNQSPPPQFGKPPYHMKPPQQHQLQQQQGQAVLQQAVSSPPSHQQHPPMPPDQGQPAGYIPVHTMPLADQPAGGPPAASPPYNANKNNSTHPEVMHSPPVPLASGLAGLNLGQNVAVERFEGRVALDESDA